MAEVVQKVAALVSSSRVLVFSKTYCPYCKEVKALFNSLNEPMVVVELDEVADGDAIQVRAAPAACTIAVLYVVIG
jgi:glutaredoxin 3